MRLIQRFRIVIILILLNITVYGQNLTSSPYSIFGMGEISDKGNAWNNGMGGVGIGLKAERGVNSLNPASLSSLDSLLFIYEIGVVGKFSNYYSENTTENQMVSNLCYISMAFRANKWWAMNIGISPFSNLGYNINKINNMENDNSIFNETFLGSGGINQIYSGNSFKINKNISLGLNLSYLFGSMVNETEISLDGTYTDYTVSETRYVSGFYLDYGIQFEYPLNKYNWSFGAVYGTKRKMNTSNTKYIYDISDEVIYSNEDFEIEDDFLIPQKFGLGIAFYQKEKFSIAFDYLMYQWSDLEFTNENLKTRNSNKYSLGCELSPSGLRSDNKLKNWYYRIGGYYNQTYLIVDNVPINSMAVTFGVGVPIKRNLSLLNFAFEMGKYGTTTNRLIKENFYTLTVNLSLQDIWFMKRKIN